MNITTFGWISLGFSLGLLQMSISKSIYIYIYTLYMYICICILDIISYPLAQITDLYSWRINPPKTKTGTSNQGHQVIFQGSRYIHLAVICIQDTNSPETKCIPGPIWICNFKHVIFFVTRIYKIEYTTIYHFTMICQKIYDPRHPGPPAEEKVGLDPQNYI